MLYKLNRRVEIKRWANAKNEFGGLTAVEVASWNKWAEVRSSNWINLDLYNTRSGRANEEYQQTKWEYDTTIILRYEKERPTRSNDTIVYNNETYVINSISVNNEYAKNYEVIKCSKIDSAINNDAPVETNTIKFINFSGTSGQATYTNSSLISKSVFAVFKDGIQYAEILTGTPVGKEVIVNKNTGTLTFGIPFEQDEVGTIIYY